MVRAGFSSAEGRPAVSYPAIAVKATQLGDNFPGDSADRVIVATAILESASLVTKDSRIRDYPAVTSVW
jgi:PIN domain nuclease of toxin-antitoxin system